MIKALTSVLTMALLFVPAVLRALPDDLNQDLLTSCPALSESYLDQGLEICRGTADEPAQISQGSLRLSGLEITIERVQGVIQQVTATGEPASFQQQPEVDQAIVYANGERIVFNNGNQTITIEGDASFSQQGTIDTTAARIDYDIANRKLDATQMNMVIPGQPNL